MHLKKKIMFYCQPVLGMGHLVRSLEIVRGLAEFDVWFINGGAAIVQSDLPSHATLVNLPPMQSDPEFKSIESIDPTTDPERIKAQRKSLLLEAFAQIQPDILLIELFPFGRLKFDFELIPLLEAARNAVPQVRIVCSLRDILVAKRDQQAFDKFVIETVNRYFDLILIHADPSFQALEETFPRASELRCPVEYTGYVVQPAEAATSHSATEKTIVVSIGGGRVGVELLECAAEASRLIQSELPHRMLIFTGPYLPESDFLRLKSRYAGDDRIRIERYTSRFVELLRSAALSVSMAGYNTCLNIIVSGVPAIVYPFTGNNNREQTIRANKLKALGIVEIVEGDNLTPGHLAAMMKEALSQPNTPRRELKLDLRGVEKTAQLLSDLCAPWR